MKRIIDEFLSESGRPKFEIHWHKYKGKRNITFSGKTGKPVVLAPNDIFGVQEYSQTHDIISFPETNRRFKYEIAKSERLMEKSANYRGAVKVNVKAVEPKVKQAKVKIKPTKVQIVPDSDEDLDARYGNRVIEPLDEMDEVTDDEIRDIMNSLGTAKLKPKQPKA